MYKEGNMSMDYIWLAIGTTWLIVTYWRSVCR